MPSFRLAIATIALAASFGINSASALEINQTGNTAGANFSDPEDAIPYPHIADDGQPSNFQDQPVGNSGASFGLTPSGSQSGAFERAQDRMQQ